MYSSTNLSMSSSWWDSLYITTVYIFIKNYVRSTVNSQSEYYIILVKMIRISVSLQIKCFYYSIKAYVMDTLKNALSTKNMFRMIDI